VAISDRIGKIFIDDSQVYHIANSVFTAKETAVRAITMVVLWKKIKLNQSDHVTISYHDFLYNRSGNKNFKSKNLLSAFWKIVILKLLETRRVLIM